jgi:sec-independent protein translocase protein TatA
MTSRETADLGEVRRPRLLSLFARLNRSVFPELRSKGDSMFEGLFQPMHMLVLFGIALLVFGPKKLPELGKGLGESIRGFKLAMAAKDQETQVTDASSAKQAKTEA